MFNSGSGIHWLAGAWLRLGFALTIVGMGFSCPVSGRSHRKQYVVAAIIPAATANGQFDYASVDAKGRRLYLAQEGVTVLDLDSGKVIPHFVRGRLTHGVVSLEPNR